MADFLKIRLKYIFFNLNKQKCRVHKKRNNPRYDALSYAHRNRPLCTQFVFDCGNGGDARRIKERKYQKHNGCGLGKERRQERCVSAEKNGERADNALLCRKACDKRCGYSPIGKSERFEYRGDGTSQYGKQAVLRLCTHV